MTGHENPAPFLPLSFLGRSTQAFRGGDTLAPPPVSPREIPGPPA
ncbi:hypothetical protein ASZ90_015108 [hydrocarbon metagenome]|uniref:Uncharacterized protein n=1 Tax=hydrocarbon metagenome TaxID=938273 RepID=A0A0W8F2X2_9ZZZZ